VASEAIVLVDSSSEIDLLGPVSSIFEASVLRGSGLFGHACNVPLQAAKEQLFSPFHPLYTAKPTLGALLTPLFGQSQKGCSPKFEATSQQPLSSTRVG